MSRFARRQYGSKAVSKTHNLVALKSLLAMRRTLDGLDRENLARSYGVDAATVDKLVAEERRRRAV